MSNLKKFSSLKHQTLKFQILSVKTTERITSNPVPTCLVSSASSFIIILMIMTAFYCLGTVAATTDCCVCVLLKLYHVIPCHSTIVSPRHASLYFINIKFIQINLIYVFKWRFLIRDKKKSFEMKIRKLHVIYVTTSNYSFVLNFIS